MKKTFLLVAIISLCATTLCFGKHPQKSANSDQDLADLVTSIKPGPDGTSTIAISGNDIPFVADAQTTVVINGKNAQLTDVKVGMQVLSRTAAGNATSEIDLKTVAARPSKPGKSKKPNAGEQ